MSLIEEQCDEILLSSTCRICLNSDCDDFVTLEENNGWLQLFKFCFGFSLPVQDKLHILCDPCATKVKSYSNLKEECLKSNIIWQNQLSAVCKKSCADNISNELIPKDESDNEEITNDNSIMLIDDNENNIHAVNATDNSNDYESDDNMSVKIEVVENELALPMEASSRTSSKQAKNNNNNDEVKQIDKQHSSKEEHKFSDKVYECKRCHKVYAKRSKYSKHLKSCKTRKKKSSSSNLDLSGTEINLDTTQETAQKVKEHNIEKKYYDCGICKFSSNNIEGVKRHLKEHWTNEEFNCMLCEYVGKDQAAILVHRFKHINTTNSALICHMCEHKCHRPWPLEFHYRKLHLRKAGGLCSQPDCDKEFNEVRLWKRHERSHDHPGYICDICGQKYKHKHVIAAHIEQHANPSYHVCDICGKDFAYLRNLKVHVINVHTAPKPVKCDHCNRTFKNPYHLMVHQKRMARQKVFKCDICPLEFTMMSLLRSHKRSHSDERPFCCDLCSSKYKTRSQLNVHLRKHTGDRPYKCKSCDKAFQTGTNLKRHMAMHTGTRATFKCPHCKKSFGYKKRMVDHIAICSKANKENSESAQ